MVRSNLTDADLKDAAFNDTLRIDANFTGADLDGATWIDTTCLDGANSGGEPGGTGLGRAKSRVSRLPAATGLPEGTERC